MSDSERLVNSLYMLIFSEETKLESEIHNSFENLKINSRDSYYITKHLAIVQRYEDFKIFQRKVIEVLKLF